MVRHDLHLMFRNPHNSISNLFQATKFPHTLPQTNMLTTPDDITIPKAYCIKLHSRGQHCERGNACTYTNAPNAGHSTHYETWTSYRHQFLYKPQTTAQPHNAHHKTTYTPYKHYSTDSRNWIHGETAHPGEYRCHKALFVWLLCYVSSFLVDGFKHGFDLDDDSAVFDTRRHNSQSVHLAPD